MIRVFPRRTAMTPTDDLVFVGWPPLIRPTAQEVHISVCFTWDIKLGLKLADAWNQYILDARTIFQRRNLPFPRSLEEELIVSFRQARQRAYQVGIDGLIADRASDVHGIRIETRTDHRVRTVHALWDKIVLTPDDDRLERLKCPMDFGCRCNQLPVFQEEREQYPLTPENEIPDVFPGESYRRYAINPIPIPEGE